MWQPCTFINQIITRKYEVLQFSYCFKESRTKQNMPTFFPSPVCVGVGQSANTAATTLDTQCVHLSQLHYFQPGEMLHLFSDKSSHPRQPCHKASPHTGQTDANPHTSLNGAQTRLPLPAVFGSQTRAPPELDSPLAQLTEGDRVCGGPDTWSPRGPTKGDTPQHTVDGLI